MGIPRVARTLVSSCSIASTCFKFVSVVVAATTFRPIGGYHHMIQFWWSKIFSQPAIQELDYFCRLDTDAILLSTVRYDIFAFMHAKSYLYGYIHQDTDVVDVIDGLWDFVEGYIDSHPAAGRLAKMNQWRTAPNETRQHAEFDTYFNNFEARTVSVIYIEAC